MRFGLVSLMLSPFRRHDRPLVLRFADTWYTARYETVRLRASAPGFLLGPLSRGRLRCSWDSLGAAAATAGGRGAICVGL